MEKELEVMNSVWKLIEPLKEEERSRVYRWLGDRLIASVQLKQRELGAEIFSLQRIKEEASKIINDKKEEKKEKGGENNG